MFIILSRVKTLYCYLIDLHEVITTLELLHSIISINVSHMLLHGILIFSLLQLFLWH
jgi:hypothetical protein